MSAGPSPERAREDHAAPSPLEAEFDAIEAAIQAGLDADGRLESGVPEDAASDDDLAFITMSGLARPGDIEETEAGNAAEDEAPGTPAGEDPEAPLSFYEPGVADVDPEMGPGRYEDNRPLPLESAGRESRSAAAFKELIAELRADAADDAEEPAEAMPPPTAGAMETPPESPRDMETVPEPEPEPPAPALDEEAPHAEEAAPEAPYNATFSADDEGQPLIDSADAFGETADASGGTPQRGMNPISRRLAEAEQLLHALEQQPRSTPAPEETPPAPEPEPAPEAVEVPFQPAGLGPLPEAEAVPDTLDDARAPKAAAPGKSEAQSPAPPPAVEPPAEAAPTEAATAPPETPRQSAPPANNPPAEAAPTPEEGGDAHPVWLPASEPPLQDVDEEAEEAALHRDHMVFSRRRYRRSRKRLLRLAALALIPVLGFAGGYVYLRPLLKPVLRPEAIETIAHRHFAGGAYAEAAEAFGRYAERLAAGQERAAALFLAGVSAQLALDGAEDQDALQRLGAEARERYAAFLREYPGHDRAARARTLSGILAYRIGDTAEAIETLRDPMQQLNDPAAALPVTRVLARAYARDGDHENAVSMYLQAASMPRNYTPEVDYFELGGLFERWANQADDPAERVAHQERAVQYWTDAMRVPGVDPVLRERIRVQRDWLEGQISAAPPAPAVAEPADGSPAEPDPADDGLPPAGAPLEWEPDPVQEFRLFSDDPL